MSIETEPQKESLFAREAASELARRTGSPCLAFLSCIHPDDLTPVIDQLDGRTGEELQVLLCSHGGDCESAFMLAGFLRRRFRRIVVQVPRCARSAAILICLSADELVMSDLAALGPLDAQFTDDGTLGSHLSFLRGVEQIRVDALHLFDSALDFFAKAAPDDSPVPKAAEVTSRVVGQLYARVDPMMIGEATRALDTGCAYAERVLRRYNPELWDARGQRLVHRLVREYPSHGFPLDRDEVHDLGLPVRAPSDSETDLHGRLLRELLGCQENLRLIELFHPRQEEAS